MAKIPDRVKHEGKATLKAWTIGIGIIALCLFIGACQNDDFDMAALCLIIGVPLMWIGISIDPYSYLDSGHLRYRPKRK